MPPKRTKHSARCGKSEEYHCCRCDKPDSVEDMVQCDMCNAWNHFSCAGVNASIQEKAYICNECAGKSTCVDSFTGVGSAAAVNSQMLQMQSTFNTSIEQSNLMIPSPTAANLAATQGSQANFETSNEFAQVPLSQSQSVVTFPAYVANESTTVSENTSEEQTLLHPAYTKPSSTAPICVTYAQAPICAAYDQAPICASNRGVLKVSAHSAAEVAAMCGSLLLPSNATLRTAYSLQSATAPICATTQGFSNVSAHSAAEVAAVCGNISISSNTLIRPAYSLQSSTAPICATTRGVSKVSAHSAAEVAAMCGNLSLSSNGVLRPVYHQPSSTAPICATYVHRGVSAHSVAEVATVCGKPSTFNNSSCVNLSQSYPFASASTNTGYNSSFARSGHSSTMKRTLHPDFVLPKDEFSTVCAPRMASSKKANSSRSSKSSSSKKIQIELQRIEEELKLRQERDAEYIEKKYQIMSRVFESSDDDDDVDPDVEEVQTTNANVNHWISGVTGKDLNNNTTNVVAKPSNVLVLASQPENINRSDKKTSFGNDQQGLAAEYATNHFLSARQCHEPLPPENHHPQQTSMPWTNENKHHVNFVVPPSSHSGLPFQTAQHHNLHTYQTAPEHFVPANNIQPQCASSNNFLTKNHLAARHLIRDLPNFDGNPSEWPLFLASFNRSTELGGFSSEENMLRLQRALKGDALEAVKSMIIQPNGAQRVLETLRMLYGRPELIINTLISNISATPSPKADKLETLVTYAIAVQNLCATLEVSGAFNNLNYPTLLQQLVDKLPPALRLKWALHKVSLPICTLYEFSTWMYMMAEAANGVLSSAPSSTAEEKKIRNKSWKNKGIVNAHYKASEQHFLKVENKCCVCGSYCASVAVCKHFLQLNRGARWAEVRKHQLCSKCLKRHENQRCQSEAICGKNNCSLKHHQLLHKDQTQSSSSPPTATVGIHSKPQVDSMDKTDGILFRIVPVFLYAKGAKVKVYALLDEGSSVTLLDEDILCQLNVRGVKHPLCLKWTGNTTRLESRSELINLQISGTKENAEKFQITNVHTVQKLALPAQTLNETELQMKFEHLRGLSFESYGNIVPRLLIGVNNAHLGHPLKSKEGGWNEPIATKTRLGWVVHGNCRKGKDYITQGHNFHICDCNDAELKRLVKEFICDDNFGATGSRKPMLSEDDARALELLSTRTIWKTGRFETTLLWKIDDVQLPDSYSMAKRRFDCLQKRMERNPDLAKILDDKIKDYVSKGYARKVTSQEIQENQSRSWYLPIFPVENDNKPGKVRIVWDAAATAHGHSLNSVLLKGPDQLTPLTSVIHKFRHHKIAICGDIKEMFHQVRIRKEDQHYQRFLWGCNQDGKPDTYIMMVMTFGATCSPCTAQFIKNTNADLFASEYPRAVRSIKENHYVDDLMDSVPTEAEAIKLAQEVRHIHNNAGFYIRNWISNSSRVLQELQTERTEQVSMNINPELGTEKVLGMWWCTSVDCLTFKITSNPKQREVLFGSRRPTKREVLRVMMTIFDPLGLIACFLMYIKILLQDIWRSQIEWDDTISDEEYAKWTKWTKHLPEVENVKIPRCYVTAFWGSEIQLHIFVDASENGYAAVAYLRNTNKDVTEVSLIGAKTRVAPLKSLSIPRLELQAALLGARFAKSIAKSHEINFSKRIFWSDSKTVLCWLRSDHRKYRQFVAFRVSEILDLCEISEWRWTPTSLNVADEATKWQKPPDLTPTSRWFNGPKFLRLAPDAWPQEKVTGRTIEELKTNFIGIHTHSQESTYRFKEISSWRKLLRSTAYVHRFIHNTSTNRTNFSKFNGPLSRKELQIAENHLLREAQAREYEEEIADLSMNRRIQKSSRILNLNPFVDENRILRANGRTCLAEGVSEDVKKPIILPRYHDITRLIIKNVHHQYGHRNDETVVNVLRQRFYISHIRSVLKSIKKVCQTCKNNKAQPRPPIMAPLPPARLASFCRPFSYVGVDYFGPITVTLGRRSEKRWGVLLTCLTIRAVHIEVAHSLTTDSCILCLRNFMARRGTPIEIYSDNGTNFHGAERELREAVTNIQKDRLVETFTTTNTQWKFIPPGSPHMGGSWERLVRSIKNVLYATTPNRNPSDELLRSMLIEAENILNSRPLTYIPIDPENPEALTPNHFLLGSACGSKPLVEFSDDVTLLRKSWLISQQFADRFWKRWVAEYLPTLTRRSKWFTPTKPPEVGDIVLVVDPNSPRNNWPKGRIVKVKLSKDQQVRSAVVQTQFGLYERPVVKLAVLDVEGPGSSDPPAKVPRESVKTKNARGNFAVSP